MIPSRLLPNVFNGHNGLQLGFFNYLLLFLTFSFTSKIKIDDPGPSSRTSEKLFTLLQEKLTGWTVTMSEKCEISVESVQITVEAEPNDVSKNVIVSWTNQDEDLGSYILGLLQNMG